MKTENVVITGASRGIGRAIAERLASENMNIIAGYVKEKKKAEELCRSLTQKYGVKAVPFGADISKAEGARRLISKAVYEFGRIDALINNAGVCSPTLFLQTTDEELRRVFSVNFDGAFFCTREASREMLSSGGGRIVNVSSMWGICGASGESAYASSKAALIGLTRSLAKELAPSKITVNCVAPGVINTEMNACYDEKTMESLRERTPLGRIGEPEDVAAVVSFLLSEGASFITGQTVVCDGGFSL